MFKFSRLNKILLKRKNLGYCAICDRKTIFIEQAEWLRDHYVCIYCNSIPRNRALIRVLDTYYPSYRKMIIHESSPCGPCSDKLNNECEQYIPTHYWPDIPPGEFKQGIRCENLERMTFQDNVFDLFITQDVLEHVINPEKAFVEIARTLKPGGAHVFTVPWYYWKDTLVRATEKDGVVNYLEEKIYHGNPIDTNGSLVATEWGNDFVDLIYRTSGMTTTVHLIHDRKLGLDGKFLEVFVSRKSKDLLK